MHRVCVHAMRAVVACAYACIRAIAQLTMLNDGRADPLPHRGGALAVRAPPTRCPARPVADGRGGHAAADALLPLLVARSASREGDEGGDHNRSPHAAAVIRHALLPQLLEPLRLRSLRLPAPAVRARPTARRLSSGCRWRRGRHRVHSLEGTNPSERQKWRVQAAAHGPVAIETATVARRAPRTVRRAGLHRTSGRRAGQRGRRTPMRPCGRGRVRQRPAARGVDREGRGHAALAHGSWRWWLLFLRASTLLGRRP